MRSIVKFILVIFVLQIIALIFPPWRLEKLRQWINEADRSSWTKRTLENQTSQRESSSYWDLDNPPKFDQFEYFWPAPDMFAYVWVADGFNEVCSALTAFQKLKSSLTPKSNREDIDYLLLFPLEYGQNGQIKDIKLIEKWANMGGILEEVEIKLEHIRRHPVLRKNRLITHAFSLLEYTKIIVLNGNGIIMKNLDHLFTLAEQNVAQVILSAPKLSNQEHIYGEWKPCFGQRSPLVGTSLLMFQPLISTRDRIIQYTRGQSGIWTVEAAVNHEFACNDELNVLPQNYLLEMGSDRKSVV